MALRVYPSFSLLFVAAAAVVLLFAAGGAEARFKGINQWCRTSDYKALCTQMVKGATTQKDAIANAVTTTLDVTLRMGPLLDGLGAVEFNLPNVTKDAVVSTCRDSFGSATDNLKDALLYLQKVDDPYTTLDRIQTAETNLYGCADAVTQMGGRWVNTPLARASKIIFKFASNCLAVATQM
ncbi:hypothetical protein RHGRI_033419 [Rhododendron griersonianum]|uniref:Pectinesterase inhibitor domain-containing protein n=1 Tax=Rhododendron griersonianum TaxID=479676 RepID=A0AAV6HZ94_9ERIC|nr:hypothetical protein RHGRI_033419 [Rhododendron griersonianum]